MLQGKVEQIPERNSDRVPETPWGAFPPVTLEKLNCIYESRARKLVIDPAEAYREFGEEIASQLKLDVTGKFILWPQPSENPDDPQNWPASKKRRILVILTLAAFVPDFASGIGIACLFPLAREYNTSTTVINNLTSNWSIFLLGPGGILAVILVKRYGRLPVLFWSQVLGLAFLIGCTLAKTLNTFAAMRCLNSFFSTAPQILGLYCVNDMYPFHQQARMLNVWTSGFLVSPFVSPWLFGYLVARANYRWAYGIGCLYCAVVVVLIAIGVEETWYDRTLPLPLHPTCTSRSARLKSLVGITGYRTSKDRSSWTHSIMPIIRLLTMPHVVSILIYLGAIFGFGIGINVTNVVFTTSPPPLGYGISQYAVASLYAVPIVSVVLGELTGRHLTDRIVFHITKRNHGVFEPEMRLWSLYIGLPLFVGGMILLGAAFQEKLNLTSVVFGWGLAEIGIMISTVGCYSYMNNSVAFPGEISALLNQARTLGGFAVPYFQVEWASSRGSLQTFGCEAVIIFGLFLLVVPTLQLWGGKMRANSALKTESHNGASDIEKRDMTTEKGKLEKTPSLLGNGASASQVTLSRLNTQLENMV